MNKKYGFTLSCKSFRSRLLRALYTQSQRKTFANQVSFAPLSHTYGFTFAEVMITLVIVGVVSMLVVPNLLDSTNQKVNLAAAKKAKYEIAQASLMVQSDEGCMRWRNCDVSAKLASHLRNTGEIQYKIRKRSANSPESSLTILASVDGSNTTSIGYNATSSGTITDVSNCTVDNYENGTTTTNNNNSNGSCVTWSSATTGESADWLDGN